MNNNVILSSRKFLPDKFKSLSTIWYSVALPGFTLPVDVIPISDDVLKDLGTIQKQVGKPILGIPQGGNLFSSI
jgi:hypothetical protein